MGSEKSRREKTVGMLCNKNLNDGFFSSLPTTTDSEHINIQYSHTKARVGVNRNIVELLMVFKEKWLFRFLKQLKQYFLTKEGNKDERL